MNEVKGGPAFHDRTLTGVAVMEAWLARDTDRLRAIVDTAPEGDLVGGLVNVCRYLLRALESSSGISDPVALRAIRERSVEGLTFAGPTETHPAGPGSSPA